MSRIKSNIKIKPGSERGFGLVFCAVFVLIALYPLLMGGELRLWSLGIAGVFLLLTFVYPAILVKPNYWWFKLGMLLGAIVAPLVMLLVYALTIVPMGLIVKLLAKDLLRLKLDKNAESYWIKRADKPQSMQRQF